MKHEFYKKMNKIAMLSKNEDNVKNESSEYYSLLFDACRKYGTEVVAQALAVRGVK